MLSFLLIILASSVFAIPIDTGSDGHSVASTGPRVVPADTLLKGDDSGMRNVGRDLEQVVQPVLQAAQPLADGVDQGAAGLGDHAANAADAAGEAVNQAAAGAGDIAQGALQGAAGTVGEVPGRVDQLLQALDNGPSLLGELDKVLLGRAHRTVGGQ